MKIRSGVDIVDLNRIKKSIDRQGDAFIDRVFTPSEKAYCDALKDDRRIESYGARFAAKEAASKALGTGIMAGGISLRDFEVRKDDDKAPVLVLSGKAEEKAGELGISDISISLSHDGGIAIAVCYMLVES